MTKTKFEAMDILNKFDIPCGPILSMKEIAEEPSLRATGTVVEVDHPTRGKYLTVGNPIKMSDSITEVTRSPLLGEHTEEVLASSATPATRSRELRAEKSSEFEVKRHRARSQHEQHHKATRPRSGRSSTPSRPPAAIRSRPPRASWSATPTASPCRRKAW